MEYAVVVNSIGKKYGSLKALDSCSMKVPRGSIYGFIGKNGAGKTTLIRILCGLQYKTSGEFILFGKKDNDRKVINSRKRMGAVVETPSIYQEMSAYENLKQQFYIHGIPSLSEIEFLLNLVGLANTGKRKVKDFSLGMRQRLGIAIALVNNPDFLILDEPTNGLDPQGIIEIRELILKLNRERNITFLISSHLLDELSKIATHYGFIDCGKIVKEISVSDLEKQCGKYTKIEVTKISALTYILDSQNLDYKVMTDTIVYIYGKVKISQLAIALDKENCEIISLGEKEENLESYFVNLIKGEDNE